MSITLGGKVLDYYNLAITNIWIALKMPDGTLSFTQSNSKGIYFFEHLEQIGSYEIYELNDLFLVSPEKIDSSVDLPLGFNANLTPRHYTVTIDPIDLSENSLLDTHNFVHTYHEPFTPCSDAYILNNNEHTLNTLNFVTGKSNLLTPLGIDIIYTSLAYHPLEDFLFAYNKHSHTIDKLGPNSLLHSYKIYGLPIKDFTVSAFDHEGNLFLYEPLDHTLYKINFNSISLDFLSYVSYNIQPMNCTSFCFHPTNKKLYSLNPRGQVIEINFYTNVISTLPTLGTPALSHFQLTFDYNGYLYVVSSTTDIIYRIMFTQDFSEASCEIFCHTHSRRLFKNPLTRCPLSPLYINLGSAPAPYITAISDDGPRHINTNLLSFELQDLPEPLLLTEETYLVYLLVTNQTGKTAYIYGWIDYNLNGIFEPNEALTPITIPTSSSKQQVVTGTFKLPDKQLIRLGESFIRLRLTTDQLERKTTAHSLADSRSLGACNDGTVIDSPITLTSLPPYISDKQYHKTLLDIPLRTSTLVIDPSKGKIMYSLEEFPKHGNVIIDSITNTWEYTPFPDYIGEDIFTLNCTSDISLLSCQIPITISIEKGSLKLTLTPIQDEALYNTPVTFTAIIENTGTLPLEHLKFNCPKSDALKCLCGTTAINDVADLLAHPEEGIDLGSLEPNEAYTITFKVSCIDVNLMDFFASCSVHGSYMLTSTHSATPLKVQAQSNPVFLKNASLDISFNSNASTAFVGDTIQFTAKLFNSGDIPLSNIQISLALPMQLIYAGHLTQDYAPIFDDLLSGYILKGLQPKEQAILQFKCTISDITDIPYLSCLLFTRYNYLLNHKFIRSDEETVESQVKISKPLLHMNKMANKTSVSVGEIFTYTLSLCNNGDLCVNDIILSENLPPQLQVIEVSVNNRLTANTLGDGLSIHTLEPHTTTSIDIVYKVLNIPCEDPLIKIPTSVVYKLCRNDPFSEKLFYEEIIDTAGILITEASLTLFTSVDPSEASFHEVVTYTTTVCNTGTIPLKEVHIEDLLSPHLKFIEGSVTINYTSTPQSIINGITLHNLSPSEKVDIAYQVEILTKEVKEIKTQTSAHYTYVPYQSNSLKFGCDSSDPCTLYLHHPNLQLTLAVDKDIAFLGDTLALVTTLHNVGDVDIFNVTLSPTLSSCELIEGSFSINHTLINGVTLNTPISVGNLKVGERTTISFKAIVTGSSYSSHYINYCVLSKFIYPTSNQYMRPFESEEAQLHIPFALSTFKQFTLENVLELSPEKPDIETINSIGGQINLLNHYIIETPKGTAEDGQLLSGYKAIIHAILDLSVEYVSSTAAQAIHVAHYNIPFSTFVVLPPSCSQNTQILPDANIEIMSSKLINNRYFFIYSTVLVIIRLK